MLRVLKGNGILFLAVPDKRLSFDSARPITPYAHVVKDYTEGPTWSRKSHFEEWVTLVDKVTDENEVKERVQHLMNINYSIHFHVWTQAEIVEIVSNLQKRLYFNIEVICWNITEVIAIIRKV